MKLSVPHAGGTVVDVVLVLVTVVVEPGTSVVVVVGVAVVVVGPPVVVVVGAPVVVVVGGSLVVVVGAPVVVVVGTSVVFVVEVVTSSQSASQFPWFGGSHVSLESITPSPHLGN
jgi:hypothetical protein